jgi:hypothetical protein
MRENNLQWDPSVMALLPFPSVLNRMAQDRGWTEQLGNAVLAQHPDVMDAVQRMRPQSCQYGYLRSNPYDNVVDAANDIEILPTNPAYIYVPTYDPYLVFGPPRRGSLSGVRFASAPGSCWERASRPGVGRIPFLTGAVTGSSSTTRLGGAAG